MTQVKEWVSEYNETALLADGFDDAVIGICHRFGQPPLVAYDREKCIAILVHQFAENELGVGDKKDVEQFTEEKLWDEANEYFEYNVIGAWMGEDTPVFITYYEPNKS